MPQKWIQVNSVTELKHRMESYRGDTKYEWEDFRFKKAGSEDNTIAPSDHCEFLVIYQGNHIETFSMDRMPVEEIESKLEEIRRENPESMSEWLNR